MIHDAIHWALIRTREPLWTKENEREDDVTLQALHCPHYVPLEAPWGSDWGAIMHPRSVKFGQLVFEHEWCGCGFHKESA